MFSLFTLFEQYGAEPSGLFREVPRFHYLSPLITGNIMLKKPTDIELVEQKVDKRPGFFGHAVVTISWDHPQGCCYSLSLSLFPSLISFPLDYMEELYYVLKVTPIGACPGDNRQFSKSPIVSHDCIVYDRVI